MIVQGISLLDDLDKEINNYVMRFDLLTYYYSINFAQPNLIVIRFRCREWYGWHFPELSKLIQDHQAYTKVCK